MEAETGQLTQCEEEEHGSRRTSKELDVNFVLRNILEVPEVQLEGYLKHLGDPLEGWDMELCGNCEEVVNKAKRIYQEMIEAQRRFKEVKFEVISKIMSIQQGIKCGDKETETSETGGDIHDILQDFVEQPPEQNGEVNDLVDIGHQMNVHPQQDQSTGEVYKTEELEYEEDDNLLEFNYHFKTEDQFSTGRVGIAVEPIAQENVLEPSSKSKRCRERPVTHSKTNQRNLSKGKGTSIAKILTILQNPNNPHGLKMKGRTKFPKTNEGPVQCKCGKVFTKFSSLLRHVQEMVQGPEELFRCKLCFDNKPSLLMEFKHKFTLNRHVRNVHQGEMSVCPGCGSRMRSDKIKGHLKSCGMK